MLVGFGKYAKGQIILPIEVIGSVGHTKSVKINVTDATKVKGLWMLINNLSYENKASIMINNGSWVKINNATVNVPEPAKSYGGIGGAYHVGSIQVTLPLATGAIVQGENTISFKFEFADGLSSGFRVIRLNLVDVSGTKLLPANIFKEDDPNTWTQPIAGQGAVAAGKALWETKNVVEGPQSTTVLKAKCGDCHAKNGRDLKYFNYSNESIVARSKFHGLSQTEGEQIASYIRSLDVPNPGRPWNPPYQPGPGIDSKPVNEWAAGAGIDWVLEKDEMAYPFLFPTGIDTNAISLKNTLNVRETPVMMQFPDWNHWLPTTHPYDASFGGNKFINSAGNYLYNGEGTNTQYKYNLMDLIEAGPNQTLPNGPLFRTRDGLQSTLTTWVGELGNFLNPLIEEGLSTPTGTSGPVVWSRKFAEEVYSFRLWIAVKQWELFNGNDMEGMGKTLYGPNGEERTWPGTYRHVFDVSPHLAKIPREDFTSFNGKAINQTYTSNMWYHVQPVLSSGNVHGGGFHVVDWQYAHGNLNDLRKGGLNKDVAEPGRKLLLYVKQMQQKHQNIKGAGAEDPWFGWDILRDHSVGDMVFWDSEGLWNRTDPAMARQLMDALLQIWYTKSTSYPASRYKTGKDGYDVSQYDGWIFDMIPGFRAKGVSCELLNKIIDFGKTLPPSKPRNWDSLKVTCPNINYPQVKINSPTNASTINDNSFTVNANATVASGSISKVEFYDDTKLIGTDNSAPYSFDFKGIQQGAHLIIAKAYNQAGQASLDSRTVVVNQNGTLSSNDSPSSVESTTGEFSIYPNPAKGELFVAGNILEKATYQITAIDGRTLQTGIFKGVGISISGLQTGIYLIKIKMAEGEVIQRFVKE
jgi:hypothetical protein